MSGERRQVTAPTAASTREVGRRLGALLEPGDAVALHGPLGAGKTEFVRGLVGGAGGDPGEVSSPTFALVARYGGRVPVVHADLFRLDEASAAYDLGLEEIADDAVLAVEWAERAPSLLPADRIEVTIEGEGEGERRIGLVARGPRSAARLAALAA
ncbi:MAG TPA: tRNA (adenosine(37)-N6)-threonylcarbamoyltransferase complex ATPase subunit type 1 TsaE [Thermodesulfobacteriota bacterium]